MLRAEAVASDLLHPAVIEGVNVVVYFCRAMLFCWCTTARLMVGSRVVEVGGCERRPLALTFSMLQMFSLLRQFQSLDGDVKLDPNKILPEEDTKANNLHVLDCMLYIISHRSHACSNDSANLCRTPHLPATALTRSGMLFRTQTEVRASPFIARVNLYFEGSIGKMTGWAESRGLLRLRCRDCEGPRDAHPSSCSPCPNRGSRPKRRGSEDSHAADAVEHGKQQMDREGFDVDRESAFE
eukprot:2399758-Rhodomonas_salina.1